ncbi:hypothetical protein VXN63_05870 [Marinilactibacillus sp. XAAS-LB27]|uniref:hypothetical protein n=1 Tax=Marinilactibacillus sp. XAAS-LB27 TaxID=3114538 RepID=UPI002E16DC27|nr:hypothetical protein [Marinilactibacillus sp. XAAS-LB27]
MVITGMKVFKFVTIFSMLYLIIKIAVGIYNGKAELIDTDVMLIVSTALIYLSVSQSKKKVYQTKSRSREDVNE